jgi:protein-S-isoprenylcysteine O-methyltransferase Ste14
MSVRPTAIIVTQVCWGIFIFFWLISAFFTKRTVVREGRVESMGYRILAVLAWVCLVNADKFPNPLGSRLIARTDVFSWMAIGLSLVGLGICIWARITLGRNWSGLVTVKEKHELVQKGPYGFVRHPIYTGLMTLFAGTVVLNGRLGAMIGIVMLGLSFWIKLRREEDFMLKEFPNDYPGYMKRVKRLVPLVF